MERMQNEKRRVWKTHVFLKGIFFLRSGKREQAKCQGKGFSLSCSVLLAEDESRVTTTKWMISSLLRTYRGEALLLMQSIDEIYTAGKVAYEKKSVRFFLSSPSLSRQRTLSFTHGRSLRRCVGSERWLVLDKSRAWKYIVYCVPTYVSCTLMHWFLYAFCWVSREQGQNPSFFWDVNSSKTGNLTRWRKRRASELCWIQKKGQN